MAKFYKRLVLIVLLLGLVLEVADGETLEIGFYDKSCPSAEETVRSVVARAYATKWDIAPALLRMHFHDCFVRGCDGSVLLDSTGGNLSEKDAVPNLTLKGFEVIDNVKSMIEAQCPQTVSCADILTFAARDSAHLTGKIYYQVPAGRRDGLVSIASEVELNIPSPLYNATQLIASFAAKNLTSKDMVTLVGAHSIGMAHCISFINRLYNFSRTHQTDPTLDPIYASFLKAKCPPTILPKDPTVVPLNVLTPTVLDNMYYVGLKLRLELLSSDQAMLDQTSLQNMVIKYEHYPKVWDWEFEKAMVKMGNIQVLTGNDGEIRKNCSMVNGQNRDDLLQSFEGLNVPSTESSHAY